MADRVWALVKAVAYELQPVRLQDLQSTAAWLKESACSPELWALLATACELLRTQLYGLSSLPVHWYALSAAWLGGWALFAYLEFGSLWLLLSLFGLLFANLGERKAGEVSAYSVFNAGFKRLLGTRTAEDFEQDIGYRPFAGDGADGEDEGVLFDDIVFDENEQVGEGEEDFPVERAANQNGAVRNNNNRRIRGKKSRRNYEERIQRRQQQQQMVEELLAEDFAFN